MTAKTNAVRVLDDAQIAYELLEYSLSDDDFSAIAVANHLEMASDRIYKTLIAIGDSGDPVFAVVPAGAELDLKRLAKHCAERRMSLAPLVDVLPLTGYPRGAVTVLGARRAFPVVIDEMATVHESIAVSAGAKGLQVLLPTAAFLRLTAATVADIGR